MSLKLGAVDVADVRLGGVAVRLVLGTEQVWPVGPLVPTGRVLAVEGPDTAEVVGTVLGPVVGLVAALEGPHVADLAGTVTLPTITGTVAVIEAEDLASILGTSTAPPGVVVGPVVVVEADDLAAVIGTVAAPVYTGTIDAADDDDLAAIVGTTTPPVFTGTIVAVEADAFAALVGTVDAPVYTATISVVAGDDTGTITGTSSAPIYTGTVAVTEADDTSTITGEVVVAGTVAGTEDADTSTITGTVTSFPAVASSNSKVGTSLGSANAQNMPAGITAGDLLVAFVAVDLNGTTTATTASAGWVQILDVVQGTSVVRLTAFAKIAAGGDTLSVTGSTNDFACSVHRITGHDVRNFALDIVATTATNTTGNGDPPNLAPGSTQDFLWLAAEAVDLTTGNTITSVPTNYAELFRNVSASSTTSVALAVGSRALTGSAENPGTFTNSPTTRPWAAATVSIARIATPVTGVVAVTEANDVAAITDVLPGGTYNEAVIASGPVAFWPLDETAGTTADDAIGSLNGTYTGAYTLNAGTIFGQRAIDLAGGYVAIPDNAALSPQAGASGAISFECLVNLDTLPGGQIFIAKGDGNYEYGFGSTLGTTVAVVIWTLAGTDVAFTSTLDAVLTTGTDLHLVGTFDRASATIVIYVNGVSRTLNSYSVSGTSSDGPSPVNIGRRPDNSTPLDGKIAGCAIYNRVLSATEVADHYAAAT